MAWRPPCPTPLCFVGVQFLSTLTSRIAKQERLIRHYYKQNRYDPKGLTSLTDRGPKASMGEVGKTARLRQADLER